MTLTVTTPVLGTGTLHQNQFVRSVLSQPNRTQYSLREVQDIAHRVWHWCKHFGINHDIVYAQIAHETDWLRFTGDVDFGQHNFAGLGATGGGVKGNSFLNINAGVLAVVAHHAVYRWGPKENWPEHLQDYASMDIDPRYQPALNSGNAGKMIVLGDYRGTWAVPGRTYPESIIARYNQINSYGDEDVTPIIALAAGHRNSTGGGASGEQQRTGPLTNEIAKQLRAHGGFDVRVITPNDGLGVFNGNLTQVARAAVDMGADFFLEVHFEGVGNSTTRGCFAIYPDWTGDLDTGIRDNFPIASHLRAYTGIPLRGDGTMSERSTNVGLQGYRLGVFAGSEPAKNWMSRTIVEYGTLTNPHDRTIIDGPNFNRMAAEATVEALVEFFGLDTNPDPPPIVDPHQRYFPETQQTIQWGFKGFWERLEAQGLAYQLLGYPNTGEFTTNVAGNPRTVQIFERGALGWYPESAGGPWEFRMLTRGELWSAITDARERGILV